MAFRILVAPDKFKGTLTARQAAEAIAAGWRQARPEDELVLFPISDGGDGFGEVLGQHFRAEELTVETVDAAHRPLQAKWWWQPKLKIAIVESAQAVGLARLPPGRFHPFELDTFGLGALLQAAAQKHPRLCLVGLGGSATNDGGFGMARALGWRFVSRHGELLEQWTHLPDLGRVVRPDNPLRFQALRVGVDVRTRLLGRWGATSVFGPQKGIRPEDVKPAERCLRRLSRVIRELKKGEPDYAKAPGAGAAGGLGFALQVFVRGWPESGFKLFAGQTHIKAQIRRCQLVITGEGMIDETTVLTGKGVGMVAHLVKRPRIPCLGLAGALGKSDIPRKYFTELHAIAPGLTNAEAAMAEPTRWLQELARQTAQAWTTRQT